MFDISNEKTTAFSEKELEREIVQTIIAKGFDENKAKKIYVELLNDVKRKIAAGPPLPNNFGDYLLENEKTNRTIRQMLAERRSIGVTEQEIRDWWNKSALERGLVIKCFEMDLKSAFMLFRVSGLSYDESGEHVRKIMTVYGERDFNINLPYEWKDKIDRLLLEATTVDLERVEAEVKLYPSVNDYVRDKIIGKNDLAIQSPEHFN